MSQTTGTPEAHDEHDHAPDAHGAAAGHAEGAHGHDDHMHGGMALGAVDTQMWLAGVAGVAFAIVVTVGFVLASSFSFSA